VVSVTAAEDYGDWIEKQWGERGLPPIDFARPHEVDEDLFDELLIFYMADPVNEYRPPRRYLPAQRIVEFWSGTAQFSDVWDGAPACFRCHDQASRWGDLERAHLVTRIHGGLDVAGNLVMLCGLCHRVMPRFWPGEYELALWWAGARAPWEPDWVSPFPS
jgi:hypothetical protein